MYTSTILEFTTWNILLDTSIILEFSTWNITTIKSHFYPSRIFYHSRICYLKYIGNKIKSVEISHHVLYLRVMILHKLNEMDICKMIYLYLIDDWRILSSKYLNPSMKELDLLMRGFCTERKLQVVDQLCQVWGFLWERGIRLGWEWVCKTKCLEHAQDSFDFRMTSFHTHEKIFPCNKTWL